MYQRVALPLSYARIFVYCRIVAKSTERCYFFDSLVRPNQKEVVLFTNITINLKGPICGCATQNLAWNVYPSERGPTLAIICQTCDTTLTVGNTQFVAHFKLETAYRDGIAKPAVPRLEANPTPSPDNPNVVYVFSGKKVD